MTVMAGNERGGGGSSPTNPKTGLAGNRKTKNAGHLRNWSNRGKTCLLYGSGQSTEEFRVLKDYSAKYFAQQPHSDREARSNGKKNVVRLSSLMAQQKMWTA